MNNILIIDDVLTNEECDLLIHESKNFMKEELPPPWNYSYYDFPIDHELNSKIGNLIVSEYVNLYPELTLTFNKWQLEHFRIKEFKPGKYYDYWHSEQGFQVPRIVAILIYLSDHNCGTEFYDRRVVPSKKGRAVVFPAFWTHTHRGQPCPENKSRFVMSSYINLLDDKT
jgi:hypothetical protein